MTYFRGGGGGGGMFTDRAPPVASRRAVAVSVSVPDSVWLTGILSSLAKSHSHRATVSLQSIFYSHTALSSRRRHKALMPMPYWEREYLSTDAQKEARLRVRKTQFHLYHGLASQIQLRLPHKHTCKFPKQLLPDLSFQASGRYENAT